jgi:hypothetical protein
MSHITRTQEEHKNMFAKAGGIHEWQKFYTVNHLSEHGYAKAPWAAFNFTVSEWRTYCFANQTKHFIAFTCRECGQTSLIDDNNKRELIRHRKMSCPCPVCRGVVPLKLDVSYHEKVCGCISEYPVDIH